MNQAIHNGDSKMNTVKTQPVNGFMLAAGFGVEKPMKPKTVTRATPKVSVILVDKKAEDLRKFNNETRSADIQKDVVIAVSKGLNTVNKALSSLGGITLAKAQKYFRRVDVDGSLTKFRIKPGGAYLYSVTEKGVKFIGGKDA